MARDLRTLIGCIYRDVGILTHTYVRAPIFPRPDLWDLVEMMLDSALMLERLALGVDAWGELHERPTHEKTPSVDTAQGLENCND